MIGSVWKETDTVTVDVDGFVCEEKKFAVVWVGPGLDNFQGVRGRLDSLDRFLVHPVAAIFGNDASYEYEAVSGFKMPGTVPK